MVPEVAEETARRQALAHRWAAVLRPGGVLVTTTSQSRAGTPDPFGFTPEAVDGFAARVEDAGGSGELVSAARRWAQRAQVHPVRSADDVRAVLEIAGFEVDIATHDVDGPLGATDGGPTAARSARYLEIVARR